MEQLLMQSSEIGNQSQINEIKLDTNKVEGFDQAPEQPMISIQRKLSIIKEQSIDTFYKIPEAKPLLSKQYIDFNKPKVLIKEVLIYKEPQQLLSSKTFRSSSNLQHTKFNQNRSVQKPHQKSISPEFSHRKSLSTNEQNQQKLQYQNSQQLNDQLPTTLWQKYLIRSGYECIYLKYLRDSLNEEFLNQKIQDSYQRKEQKKRLKLELLKMCRNNENLFNTYFIDLDFITQAGTTLIRNLHECNFNELYDKWINKKDNENVQNQDIEFDSRFQCGNLFSVFQKIDQKTQKPIQSRAFDLILQNDINTKGYTNWFYFSIKSKKKGMLKFNIVNMYKGYSLYNQGMKVCVFSYQRMKNEGIEWVRDGFDYSYRSNELLKSSETNERYSTLSFNLQQKYDNDIIFIAANVPYSYSKLLRFIESIQKVARLNSNIYLKRSNHITSISSNSCPLLTVTWKRDKNQKTNYKKKVIAIIGRQHPCQTVASFVMEGIINSLVCVSNESSAQLLKRYIFKVIPMFNVDGVIYGNARCDISGTDVNRKWTKSPNSFLYPIIKATKRLYHELLNQNYEIDYFIDLHGHSKKLGAFIYSCKNNDLVESRIFTWLMSKISNKFVLENCIFSLAKNKKQTARGSMAHFVTNKKSFTVETSFFGWKRSNINSTKHFEIKDLHEIGESLLKAIYVDQSRDPKLYNWSSIKSEIKASLVDSNRSFHQQEQSQSGSDSDPQNDEMTLEEKTNSFLPSNTATKIGLVEVKIVQKSVKPKSRVEKREKQLQNNQILEGFRLPINEEPQNQDNHLKSYFSNRLIHNFLEPQMRQSKSVTKISPFKFTQRERKSLSTKKIKIAVDIIYVEKNKQKMSNPSFLPQIQEKQIQVSNQKLRRKNFWNNFNRQFQTIVKQRENILSNRQSQIINKEKLIFGTKSLK